MMKTNEDRNVIGVLGGHSEFLESDSNVLEGLGGAWLLTHHNVGLSVIHEHSPPHFHRIVRWRGRNTNRE